MNQNKLKWYAEHNFPETVIKAAEEIANSVEKFYDLVFDVIFISNIQNEGHEEYPSLWLLGENDIVECKNFISARLDVDIARYKGNIRYINLIMNDRNMIESSTADSTMKLIVSLSDDLRCTFDARGANCDKLKEIARLYLKEFKSR